MALSYTLSLASLSVIEAPSRCLVTLFDIPFSNEPLSLCPGGARLEPIFADAGFELDKLQFFSLSDPDEVLREFSLLDRSLLCVTKSYEERLDDESLHVVQSGSSYQLLQACVTADGGWVFSCPATEREFRTEHWPVSVEGYGVLVGRVVAMVYEPKLPTRR